jgi:hypothetical protein
MLGVGGNRDARMVVVQSGSFLGGELLPELFAVSFNSPLFLKVFPV